MILSTGRVAAQQESAAGEPPDGEAGQAGGITADEEITVVGQRSLRLLRLEVQLARERVYDLFNSLNIDDEFDIKCINAPRTGTRIPQRICRPQFADDGTADAGQEFAQALFFCGGLSESCLELGRSRAQGTLSVVPVKDQQLAEEVQRLTRENPEFRRAIVGFQAVERRYEDARRAEGEALRVSAAIVDRAPAAIPSSLAVRQRDVVAPRAVDLTAPEEFWRGLGENGLREGWVKLRYSVLADGTTADVQTVDTMPPGRDPSGAIVAAQAWAFDPATEAGRPVDWHNNLAVIVFEREEATHEGWVEFAESYEEIVAIVAEGRYEEAKSRNEILQRDLAVMLEEMAFAEMQMAAIEHALGDSHAALAAIRRATELSVAQLAEEELKLALEHRFALEFELGLAVDALETYGRRIDLGRLPSDASMARLGAALEPGLAVPDAGLAGRRRIGGDGRGEHVLTWPTFAVGEIGGRSEGLELQCNRNSAAMSFEEDVQMTIPAGWGECTLFVRGEPDTVFTVYEFKEPID